VKVVILETIQDTCAVDRFSNINWIVAAIFWVSYPGQRRPNVSLPRELADFHSVPLGRRSKPSKVLWLCPEVSSQSVAPGTPPKAREQASSNGSSQSKRALNSILTPHCPKLMMFSWHCVRLCVFFFFFLEFCFVMCCFVTCCPQNVCFTSIHKHFTSILVTPLNIMPNITLFTINNK